MTLELKDIDDIITMSNNGDYTLKILLPYKISILCHHLKYTFDALEEMELSNQIQELEDQYNTLKNVVIF